MLELRKRLRFTPVMIAVLLLAGLVGGTHSGPLDASILTNVGFSVDSLFDGEFHRLLTSVFFTIGGWRFYWSLGMFLVAAGWAEMTYGTLTTVLTFFAIHVITLLLMSTGIATLEANFDTYRGGLLFQVLDVGPSAGYYGCLGLAVAALPNQNRPIWVGIILALLAMRLAWSSILIPAAGQMFSADLAHIIAFPLGLLASYLIATTK